MASDADLVLRTADGDRFVTLASALTPLLAEQADRDANAWIKNLRTADLGGRPLRERFTFRGESLWWFAELYLHKMQVVNAVYRAALAVEALLADRSVSGVRVLTRDPVARLVIVETCRRAGVPCLGRSPGRLRRRLWVTGAQAHYHVWRARLGAWLARGHEPRATARVAAFVHNAFWRGAAQEQYVGPVLRALEQQLPPGTMTAVGLGPHTSYRARSWRRRVEEAGTFVADGQRADAIDTFAPPARLRASADVWRARRDSFDALRDSRAIRQACVIRGCDAWPVLEPVLLGVAYLQFPWSAHVMDQMGAALDTLRPRVAVTYAEAGGWGRALVLETRRRGIPSVGIQHGFIYRHWMNYHHEADEMAPAAGNPGDAGFPAPTLTLLYDDLTAEHLRRAGRFPAGALRVTGSPKLDELVAASRTIAEADLAAVRAAAGVPADGRLILVAAKFTQIGPVFGDFVRAVTTLPGVHIVVKRHPSESGDVYVAAGGQSPVLSVAPDTAGLALLTRAADLLVTVNSTAAIEAMVLGVPSLVLALPNNLSPFVEAGVMDGVVAGGDIAGAVRRALESGEHRAGWRDRAATFMARYGIGADGHAVDRAAAAILELAGGE